MRALLGFLAIFSIIGLIVLGAGVAVGFVLHWLIPAVDLGVGILIGVITIGFTAQLFGRAMSLPVRDFDDEPEYVEPPLPRPVTYLVPDPPRPRSRKRKPSST